MKGVTPLEAQLLQVMQHCRNYFTRTVEEGVFEISGGVITVQQAYLPEQYIRLLGSALNDGVYFVGNDRIILEGAKSEVFEGLVCGLSVPREFVSLCNEIASYSEKNPVGAFTSETFFNSYSYHRQTSGTSGGIASWEAAFESRLNPYRKMFSKRVVVRSGLYGYI